MKVVGLGHLAFRCRDLNASVAFYRDVLGFSHKFSLYYRDWIEHMQKSGDNEDFIAELMPRFHDPWIVYMEISDRVFIELFDSQGADLACVPEWRSLNYQHLALVVEDIHAARDELLAKGIPIDEEPSFGMEGTWQMWTHDPDGNKIEFMQYTADSMQLTGRQL